MDTIEEVGLMVSALETFRFVEDSTLRLGVADSSGGVVAPLMKAEEGEDSTVSVVVSFSGGVVTLSRAGAGVGSTLGIGVADSSRGVVVPSLTAEGVEHSEFPVVV